MHWFEKIVIASIELFLPQRCQMCSSFVSTKVTFSTLRQPMICTTCWDALTFIRAPACRKCGAPLNRGTDFVDEGRALAVELAEEGEGCFSCQGKTFAFSNAYAALVYTDASKKLIMRYKHRGDTHLSRLFAPWLRLALKTSPMYDAFVPIPLHPLRLFKRGFNQASLLAAALIKEQSRLSPKRQSKASDPNSARNASECEMNNRSNPEKMRQTPLLKGALKRIRHTPQQGLKTPDERCENVKDAFYAEPALVKGKTLLLIDDVMTTGATLNQCALVLLEAGAVQVDVLVIARAVR